MSVMVLAGFARRVATGARAGRYEEDTEIMTTIQAADVPSALQGRQSFSTRSGLRAERFYRLSGPPMSTGGLTAVQERALMHAHEVNRVHYMPYCAVCRKGITFEHNGMRTWVHDDEEWADHVAELAEHENSHKEHPDGLHYVVWVGAEVVAWVLNDGRTVHVDGDSHPRLRAIVREAMGE